MAKYTIGLDYGTNSVRALVVDISNGAEVGSAVRVYAHGTEGVIYSRDPNLARQHPGDYLEAAGIVIKEAVRESTKARERISVRASDRPRGRYHRQHAAARG